MFWDYHGKGFFVLCQQRTFHISLWSHVTVSQRDSLSGAGKLGPSTCFVNKVLLEHSCAHLLLDHLCVLPDDSGRTE